jgi:hypothetical protein
MYIPEDFLFFFFDKLLQYLGYQDGWDTLYCSDIWFDIAPIMTKRGCFMTFLQVPIKLNLRDQRVHHNHKGQTANFEIFVCTSFLHHISRKVRPKLVRIIFSPKTFLCSSSSSFFSEANSIKQLAEFEARLAASAARICKFKLNPFAIFYFA